MLSGNGRHRRPRQAPALIVAAGVTGSAIAIPLLAASSASAADSTTWDKVAECESGGSWSANSGNGYYGGLQVTQENWEKYGGLDYAPTADQASRSQQIAIAEKILADQGIAAWPTCGLLSGLTKASGSVGVDTGIAGDGSSTPSSSSSSPSSNISSSSDSSDSSDTSSPDSSSFGSSGSPSDSTGNSTKADTSSGGSGSQGSDSSPTGKAKDDDSDKSGQNSGSSSGTENGVTSSGRHRGGSAAEGATDGRTDDASGRHASRGSGASRDAADGSYTVRAGDSLWAIADSLGLKGGWSELYAENKKTVGADPNLILPGQTLDLSVESGRK